jgi:hypothetical protein
VQWFSIFWTDGTSVKPRMHKKIKEKFYGLYTDLMDVLERQVYQGVAVKDQVSF